VVIGRGLPYHLDPWHAHVPRLARPYIGRRRGGSRVDTVAWVVGQVQVDQLAGCGVREGDAVGHEGRAGGLHGRRGVLEPHLVQGFRLEALRADRYSPLDTVLGDDHAPQAVPAQPLQVHGLVIAGDQRVVDAHPTANDPPRPQVVVNVDELPQSLEMIGREGVARHVEVRTEQATPCGRVVTRRIPDVGHVVDLVGREKVARMVVRESLGLAIGELEAAGVP